MWLPAKRTLRVRDRLASHWSSTHRHFWSAVRYGAIATCAKPAVDQSPYKCGRLTGRIGACLRLRSSRGLRNAGACEQSRLSAKGSAQKALRRSQRREAEVQQVGPHRPGCGQRVAKHCRHHGLRAGPWHPQNAGVGLPEPAKVRGVLAREAARAVSKLEKETEWALVCRKADEACSHTEQCEYAEAARTFFAANQTSLDHVQLAHTLSDHCGATLAKQRWCYPSTICLSILACFTNPP